jgi:hypothetical protein
MASASIHQAIHGYRDGHRLLSSSVPLAAESSRAMLVLSDMSGPSMQPGFEEYLTAYPLPDVDFFVFAKTWYAAEMQRPGCVWTHSLLIPRDHIARVSTHRLLGRLRRPQLKSVETTANAPIILNEERPSLPDVDAFEDRGVGASLLGAVLGQPRPVVVPVDTAAQLEAVFLRIWDELWPTAKARFSFCTGALMPRAVAGALMDLQAVPRTLPSAQFRKTAEAAIVLDLRSPSAPEGWTEVLIESALRRDATFRSWMEAATGAAAPRNAVPSLMPMFGQWHAPNWSARDALANIARTNELESDTKTRLVGMVFDRVVAAGGEAKRREMLQEACGQTAATDLSCVAPQLEEQTRRLFENSRAEGRSLTLSLLGAGLTEAGQRILRAAVRSLTPADLEAFGETQTPFLSTLVTANPYLASAPVLWKRAGSRSREIIAQLDAAKLDDVERRTIVDAALAAGRDAPVEALVRFAGDAAVARVLCAVAEGNLPVSTAWRSSLSERPDAVLGWIESQSSVSVQELEVVSRFLHPTTNQERLVKVWQSGIATSLGSVTPRVAAFGLALALSKPQLLSPLLTMCFQPTFDALEGSRLEYEEWEWLREQAPPLSWWRDWDKCERIATALARRLEKQDASLVTVFEILKNRSAIRKVVVALDDKWESRQYLKALRKACAESPGVGTQDQRDSLLEKW